MREIKFRVWNAAKGLREDAERIKKLFYFRLVDLDEDYIIGLGGYIDEKAILMQYTGLKDKNGVEIYEGDILGWSYYSENKKYIEQAVVEWDKNDACFNFNDSLRPSFCGVGREVIGNVHENSELLEG